MKKKIIGIVFCMILLLPMISTASVTIKSPNNSIIQDENLVSSDETERAEIYFFGLDGSLKTCIREIPAYDAEKLSKQLQAGSKAFVTLYSSDASDEEITEAKEIIDSTLLMMYEIGILPEGMSVKDAKQLLNDLIYQAKRSLTRGVIGSAGIGLLRPVRPVLALPKLIVFWRYRLGVTFSLGLNGINAKLGRQFGFALFFFGLIVSIGVTGAFFGYTPFTFYF